MSTEQNTMATMRFESGMYVGVPEKPVTRHRSNLLFLTCRGYLAGMPK
jgi:hypothetical protein